MLFTGCAERRAEDWGGGGEWEGGRGIRRGGDKEVSAYYLNMHYYFALDIST